MEQAEWDNRTISPEKLHQAASMFVFLMKLA